MVRRPGGRRCPLLHRHLQTLKNRRHFALPRSRPGNQREAARVGDGRGFELSGQSFTALTRGPIFKFNEAVSFQIECATQEEVDYYWARLFDGGDPETQQCGWLKDKFGRSWQVVPQVLPKLLNDPDTRKSQRAFHGYLLGSYRIATAPEPNSSRLTSLKSIRFDRPANNVINGTHDDDNLRAASAIRQGQRYCGCGGLDRNISTGSA
jgi:predicted 3-demethylubiquinone-9 3-methyltransferase (glyoxalase superfamily)